MAKLFGSLKGEVKQVLEEAGGSRKRGKSLFIPYSSLPEPTEGLLQGREETQTPLARHLEHRPPKTKAAAAGLGRSVRHRCWGHPPSTEGLPLPSRIFLQPFLLQPCPEASRNIHQTMALLGRALVSWISVDLSGKVSRTGSDPGSCLSTSVPLLPSGDAAFLLRGMESRWEPGPRARHGNGRPGRAGGNTGASLGRRISITHRWQPPAVPGPRGCKQTGSPWS